jgi:nitroreductase
MKITTQRIINLKKPRLKVDIINLLKDRFSPRVFSDKKVLDEDLKKIFEAARWAPSAFNVQPWFFYYAKKETAGFKKIYDSFAEFNSWAEKAAILIIGCYIDSASHGKNPYAMYDLGQAVFSIAIQAQSLGYYSHQMAGFDKDKIIKNLDLKKSIIPHIVIAIGKIGDYSEADQVLIDKDNKTRERKEIVSQET